MKTLTACFKAMGDAFTSAQQADIRAVRDQYASDGMTPEQANEAAIMSYYHDLQQAEARLIAKIKKAGGVVPKAPPSPSIEAKVKSDAVKAAKPKTDKPATPKAPQAPRPKQPKAEDTRWKVPFGKHKGLALDELRAKNPGWFQFLKERHPDKLVEHPEIQQYMDANPIAPNERPNVDRPVRPEVDVDAIMSLAKLKVTSTRNLPEANQDGEERWVIGGNSYNVKRALQDLGGKWTPSLGGWSFDEEPTKFIASAIADETGQSLKAEFIRNERKRQQKIDAAAARVRLDAMPTVKLAGAEYQDMVGQDTKDLIEIGLQYGMTKDVTDEQIEDAGHLAWAWEKKKPAFVLASEAGSGKTFVLGAGMREIVKRNPDIPITYITMNKDLIAQLKEDLAGYGILDNIEFATFSSLSTQIDFDIADGSLLIFDEAHNIKNQSGASRGVMAQSLLPKAGMAVFASATPYENPVEMAYLAGTGVFDPAGGFETFAHAYGASEKAGKPHWGGGKHLKPFAAAARAWFDKQGMYTQRRKRLPEGMVDSMFSGVDVSPYYQEIFSRVTEAYEDAIEADGSFKIAAHMMNTQKRILEASKLPEAIKRAKELLEKGEQVAIFTETKAERDLAPKVSAFDMRQANDEAAMMEEKRPYASWQIAVADAFEEHNITEKLPSTILEVHDEFGKENVALYTGDAKYRDDVSVTKSTARKQLKEWKDGKRQVFVGTMAKGGTGLSLHATETGYPRTQINLNLPWKATGVDQVSGRLARYGMQSPATIEWLFVKDNPVEDKISKRVGDRMASMGATVSGIELSSAEALQEWDFEGEVDVTSTAEIVFRKGKGKGVDRAKVEKLAERISKKWAVAPKIRVVNNINDVPLHIADHMRSLGIEGAPGDFDGSNIVLMADFLENMKEAEKTILHEAVGHYGIEAFLGDEAKEFYRTVDRSTDPAILKVKEYVEGMYGEISPQERSREIVAHIAEKGVKTSLWDKLVLMIRRALKRVGFETLMTERDIRDALARANDQMRTGRVPSSTPLENAAVQFRVGSGNDGRTPFNDRAASFLEKLGADIGGAELATQYAIRKLQNKFNPVKMFQTRLQEENGQYYTPDSQDVEGMESLISGKIEERFKDINRKYATPLRELMEKHGVSMQTLDKWLMAKHAEERNRVVGNRNLTLNDDAAGITNDQAKAILKEHSGQKAELDEMSDLVYDMLQSVRDDMRGTVASDNNMDEWESMYEFYVPLRGFKGGAKNGKKLQYYSKGFQIKGKESRRAYGRGEGVIAESPTATALSLAMDAAVRIEKNNVGNSLLNLVAANKDNLGWKVFTGAKPDKYLDKTGKVPVWKRMTEQMMLDRANGEHPDYFVTKRNGAHYFIKIEDPLIMKAMRNLGVEDMGLFIKIMAKGTRAMSALNTTYNPEFILTNLSRDLTTALVNIQGEQTMKDGRLKGKAIATQVLKDLPKAIGGAIRGEFEMETDNDWQKYYTEFKQEGGKTGFYDTKSIEQWVEQMEQGKDPSEAFLDSFKLMKGISNVSNAVENGLRLSTYVNARRSGLTKHKAAVLSKNLTVNFNRKGEVGGVIGAAYMFANASVQGTATLARILHWRDSQGNIDINRAHKLVAALAMAGAATAILGRWSADEDDDGVSLWDKIPSYVKERNLVIYLPSDLTNQVPESLKYMVEDEQGRSQTFVTIPMPYGYSVFSAAGTAIADAALSDHVGALDAASRIMGAAVGSFAPIPVSSSDDPLKLIGKTLAPSIAQPAADILVNENAFGRAIYKDQEGVRDKQPDSYASMSTTPAGFKKITEFLNDATGGNAYVEGAIDLSPEAIKHTLESYAGTTSRFGINVVRATVAGLSDEQDSDLRSIPFSRRFVSKQEERHGDGDRFYDRLEDSRQYLQAAKKLPAEESRAMLETEKGMNMVILASKGEDVRKRLTELNKGLKVAKETENKDLEKTLNTIKDNLFDSYNKTWNETME